MCVWVCVCVCVCIFDVFRWMDDEDGDNLVGSTWHLPFHHRLFDVTISSAPIRVLMNAKLKVSLRLSLFLFSSLRVDGAWNYSEIATTPTTPTSTAMQFWATSFQDVRPHLKNLWPSWTIKFHQNLMKNWKNPMKLRIHRQYNPGVYVPQCVASSYVQVSECTHFPVCQCVSVSVCVGVCRCVGRWWKYWTFASQVEGGSNAIVSRRMPPDCPASNLQLFPFSSSFLSFSLFSFVFLCLFVGLFVGWLVGWLVC